MGVYIAISATILAIAVSIYFLMETVRMSKDIRRLEERRSLSRLVTKSLSRIVFPDEDSPVVDRLVSSILAKGEQMELVTKSGAHQLAVIHEACVSASSAIQHAAISLQSDKPEDVITACQWIYALGDESLDEALRMVEKRWADNDAVTKQINLARERIRETPDWLTRTVDAIASYEGLVSAP